MKKTAQYEVEFPRKRVKESVVVENDLCWWNTYYKNLHEWKGGRIEAIYVPSIRGYDQKESFAVACPSCRKTLSLKTADVHKQKGSVCCKCDPPNKRECHFGLHPNGQVFVVRSVSRPVERSELAEWAVRGWVRQEANHIDFRTESHGNGVTLHCDYLVGEDENPKRARAAGNNLKQLEMALRASGFDFRRVA